MNSRAQGFTLVEMLIVVVIGAIVLGAVYQTLSTQERTNRQQIAVVTTEQNTRMALEVLSSELREVSATDGDIYAADSLSIRFRALRKAGFICDKDYTSGGWANVATMLGQSFVANDSVMIFLEGNKATANDDAWAAAQVSSVNSGGSCSGNFLGNLTRLVFPGGTVTAADSGGLVRSFVPVGYRLVSTTSNAKLYRIEGTDSLGVVENLATAANGGLRLRYFDINGTQIYPTTPAIAATIMRIQIKVTGTYAGGQGGSNRMFTDSLVGGVYLRGNRKTI